MEATSMGWPGQCNDIPWLYSSLCSVVDTALQLWVCLRRNALFDGHFRLMQCSTMDYNFQPCLNDYLFVFTAENWFLITTEDQFVLMLLFFMLFDIREAPQFTWPPTNGV